MISMLGRGGAAGGVADFWFGPRADRAKMREALGLAPETVAVVTVARLTRCNSHLVTLAALARLPTLVRKRVSWLIVGADGEADYMAELKAAITACDFDVRLLGALDNQQVRDVYGASDLFCLTVEREQFTSNREDTHVYLEAAACGLPSIATTDGNIADAVIDNQTGRLVGLSSEAIAGAITELTMDGIKRVSLGKRAWNRVRAMNRDRWETPTRRSLPRGAHLEHGVKIGRGRSTIEVAK